MSKFWNEFFKMCDQSMKNDRYSQRWVDMYRN